MWDYRGAKEEQTLKSHRSAFKKGSGKEVVQKWVEAQIPPIFRPQDFFGECQIESRIPIRIKCDFGLRMSIFIDCQFNKEF